VELINKYGHHLNYVLFEKSGLHFSDLDFIKEIPANKEEEKRRHFLFYKCWIFEDERKKEHERLRKLFTEYNDGKKNG